MAQASDEASQQHVMLADRARTRRFGTHPYAGCTETCSPHSCTHKHHLDLPWILRPLWGSRLKSEGNAGALPAEVSFLNIGCRDFGPDDPLAAFLGTGVRLAGLCVEKDGSMLARAREHLEGNQVHTVEAAVTPDNVRELLRRYQVSSVDILQLDIDCFDVSVLDVLLAEVHADVLVVELVNAIPPPFRFAAHYSPEFDLDDHYKDGRNEQPGYFGASLSYLVSFLDRRGFYFYKMNHMDGIWVHQSVAPLFAAADETGMLEFPVDEWACFMDHFVTLQDQGMELRSDGLTRYMREWFMLPDMHEAFRRIWGNLSSLQSEVGLPFTLDLYM
ncbi:unnamed protein product [Polarella glacialis]|uniref:Methyltransferase FkbM domain-containing protein n=1 Tax=Polarella glacialis TaxID=89957 RepID=A0A813JEB0_POLGL|nr:unnamed protein product [Polarella glacialis]